MGEGRAAADAYPEPIHMSPNVDVGEAHEKRNFAFPQK